MHSVAKQITVNRLVDSKGKTLFEYPSDTSLNNIPAEVWSLIVYYHHSCFGVKINITTTRDKTQIDLTQMAVLNYGERIELYIELIFDDGFKFSHKNDVHSGNGIAGAIDGFYVRGFKKLLRLNNTRKKSDYYGIKEVIYENETLYSFTPDGQSNFAIMTSVPYLLYPKENLLILTFSDCGVKYEKKIPNGTKIIETIIAELESYIGRLKSVGYG